MKDLVYTPRFKIPVLLYWGWPDVDLITTNDPNLELLIEAIRTSTHTQHLIKTARSQELVKYIFDRRESPLEHVVYSFRIAKLSRAALQELVRHRIASYTVESTRFALKKIINRDIPPVFRVPNPNKDRDSFDVCKNQILLAVDQLYVELHEKKKRNDRVKYIIPEGLTTRLIMTINMRSLQNVISLRADSRAFHEMRLLARKMWEAVSAIHWPWRTWEEKVKEIEP